MTARVVPPLGRLLFGAIADRARRDPDRFAVPGLADVDRAILQQPRFRQLFLKSFTEAFRAGSAGVVEDQVLVTRDWGFSPRDVSIPVVLWHGTEDRTVPARVAIKMAERLPEGHAILRKGEGHISLLLGHGEEILASLSAEPLKGS